MNKIDRSLYETADQQFRAVEGRHLLDFHRVVEERRRQEHKWGRQTHPDGTSKRYTAQADMRRATCDLNARAGRGTWLDILLEEVFEAAAEEDPAKLQVELVQSAAVIFAWLEDLERNRM